MKKQDHPCRKLIANQLDDFIFKLVAHQDLRAEQLYDLIKGYTQAQIKNRIKQLLKHKLLHKGEEGYLRNRVSTQYNK